VKTISNNDLSAEPLDKPVDAAYQEIAAIIARFTSEDRIYENRPATMDGAQR
jgi:DNA-directed RNA polymerase subunit K/omega